LLRTWAEINLSALRHNLQVARRYAGPQSRIMAVVKADAYGHGLSQVAKALADHVEWFGVANTEEAMEVEANASGKVFMLGPLLPSEREVAVRHGFVVTVSNREEAEAFNKLGEELGRAVTVHLAIDTGMGRMGCLESEAEGLTKACRDLPHLKVEGVATHFPSADEDEGFTQHQIGNAEKVFGGVGKVSEVHLSNSAGVLGFASQQPFATLFRPGLMLYGVSPMPEFQKELQPVMSLNSRVTLVREMPEGRGISYGRSYITGAATRVATIGIGYGDGYPRHLSNQGAEVLIQGQRCPLLGRVTMDQIIVDVSALETPPQPGDPVVLIGSQGEEEITATDIAAWAGTISWEILTGITRRVQRVYCED